MTSCTEVDLAAPLQFVIHSAATAGTQNPESFLSGAQRRVLELQKGRLVL